MVVSLIDFSSDLPELPVSHILAGLVEDLGHDNRAVLMAPPGAGKTTLVPLALASSAWVDGAVVVLEPRRIGGRGAANRMGALLGPPGGRNIGYTP
ncbi:MAG: hypothetical protein ACR2HR_17970, partial [Euzebya sp.]